MAEKAPIRKKFAAGTRGADTYEKLVEATVKTVFDYGYAGATMARIAQAAGFTRGALQHHFGDRRIDVIAKVADYILQERQDTYEDAFAAGGPAERWVVSADPMKAAYRDPRTWFLIEVWIASRGDPELEQKITPVLKEIEQSSDLVLAAKTIELGETDFRILKYFFRSLTRGLALEYSLKPESALFDSVIDLAIEALLALRKQEAKSKEYAGE